MRKPTLLPTLFLTVLLATQTATASWKKGLSAYNRGDFTTAAAEWRPVAERGNALAQYNLGILYFSAKGVARDYKQAAYWLRKSAIQGFALAQLNLGMMYDKGQGFLKDQTQAVAWWRKAADQGLAQAQLRLGAHCEKGWGKRRDLVDAYKWFRLAGSLGHGPTGRLAENFRSLLEKKMTGAQIAAGEKAATQWLANFRAKSSRN